MKGIPVLAFAAFSGTGKTTLIEKVVSYLKKEGLRVAVIKHVGHHPFEIDQKGKDSWRFHQAGADLTIINSVEKTALIEHRELSFAQTVSMVRNVDLILVEGFRDEPLSQIGICREATGRGFTDQFNRFVAIVTDISLESSQLPKELPKFGFDDIQDLSEFIIQNKETFTHVNG